MVECVDVTTDFRVDLKRAGFSNSVIFWSGVGASPAGVTAAWKEERHKTQHHDDVMVIRL